MRKGLTFLQYAVECRRIAHQVRDPHHRERLEDMAQAWERLAAERATHLTKAAKRNGRENVTKAAKPNGRETLARSRPGRRPSSAPEA